VRISALLLGGLSAVGAADVMFLESPGFEKSQHATLKAILSEKLSKVEGKQLCVAHGSIGHDAAATFDKSCEGGIALLGAAPAPEDHQQIKGRMVVIGAELDGVVPFSHFAVARHLAAGMPNRHFAVVAGASHATFTSTTQEVLETDLKPVVSNDRSMEQITDIIRDFAKGGGEALSAAEAVAAELATPVVDALKLEGSTKLGHVACNSDYPTNPTCSYPQFPAHSLPFGPAPAPSPPLPSDCLCGSPWVVQSAPMAYNVSGPYASATKDAFADVSDVHPFHLPHIFNKCVKPDASCMLNVTSVTMHVAKAGDLWPQGKSAPLSIYEFKTKFKSREAMRTNANDPTASGDLDKVSDMCKNINKAAFDWALEHAEASVKARFQKSGEPMVMVDDVEATIGATGPAWIKDELVFKRVTDSNSPTGSRVEVQSWKFVVGNANGGDVPWFIPAGMHYCKLLSPARAMEWIYTDSMRYSAKPTTIVV